MNIKPIATIYNNYKTKFGIPRQSGLVKESTSVIVFEPEYRDVNALRGLLEYSHLWLIWCFSENKMEKWSPTVRPPRLGGNKKMGVFATRSPFRPNPLGLSCVELDRIEVGEEGSVLYVKGADLMDQTPIFDIKPYLPHIDSHPEAKAGFAANTVDYHIEVEDRENVLGQLPEQTAKEVVEILSQDPRPGYQREEGRLYGMEYGDYEIKFRSGEEKIVVVSVEQRKGEKDE